MGKLKWTPQVLDALEKDIKELKDYEAVCEKWDISLAKLKQIVSIHGIQGKNKKRKQVI